MSLETAYNIIEKLVNDFKNNERHYLATDYSESQARLDFIDKLFIALGWDVNHEHQKNPYEQEVKVERRVKDKETQKRADYAFFLEPNYRDPKFYVEAKKPSRSLDNPYDYFQAIRYGWNAQTPLVVLTDFEEFHILDSRFKPDIKYTKERKVLSFHYTDYLDKEKFAKLYYLFSREAVGNGSLEKFAETMPKPRGKAVQKGLFPGAYQSIDESFLTELDEIRNTLARSFKKKNPALTSEELTEATQRTIDRLVFIRFLEDMLIEGEHHISNYGDKGTAWGDFIADCRSLNAKYNGIVFKEHFIDRLSPSTGGSAIAPDDKDFADICEELSHVNSPYNFNSIPIHILGSIYERFLGKVVHATDKRVTIEEKPEVRKAGGVYYTPQYIVQYIVNNTVGKLIEGKTPTEIAKLRFADISCGSGSFLITVYDTLLRYHSRYYQEHTKEAKADGCILSNGLWVLSLKQKRQILLNNVYGVDIDHQAVEVTQLSLYLKLLEDETLATANEMQAMFKEKILPDLSKNIICGNSLIGTDIYTNDAPILGKEGWSRTAGTGWSEDEERKINAMNFEDAFPAIMKNGGFDAIVGNPPYVRNRDLEDRSKDYFSKKYNVSGQYDLYQLFFEQSIKLLIKNGTISYITSNKYTIANYGIKLREFILNNCKIIKIVDVSNLNVFKDASTYPYIIVLEKEKDNELHTVKFKKIMKNEDLLKDEYSSIRQIEYKSDPNKNIVLKNKLSFLNKIEESSIKLGEICSIKETIHTGNIRNKLITDKTTSKNSKMLVSGRECRRYELEWAGKFIDYNPKLIEKEKGEYGNLCSPEYFEKPKILLRDIAKRVEATFDDMKYYSVNTLYSVQFKNETDYSLKYLLGVLNSKLISYYFNYNFEETHVRGGYLRFKKTYTSQISIKKINFNNYSEKKLHDKIHNLVDQILDAKRQLTNAVSDKDKTFYENKCNSLDRQIDRLVYELYGLTEEEIKIVEGEA